jgi:hypothetical protein
MSPLPPSPHDPASIDPQTVESLAATPFLLAAAVSMAMLVANAAAFITLGDAFAYVICAVLAGAIYALCVWAVLRRPAGRHDIAIIIGVGIVLRGLALTAPDALSTDLNRYIWDGRVQAAGINPYLYVPADPRLAHLRDAAIFPQINQKDTAVTIYPPAAELLLLAGHWISDSIAGPRTVMLAMDLAIVLALLGWLSTDKLPRERVLIYAWHPLILFEGATHAHIDIAATAFMVLAILAAVRHRQGLAGAAMAAAILCKYFPVLIIPALWRRMDWRMPAAMIATGLALYAPYLIGAGWAVFGFLGGHLANEGYRDGWGFHVIWLLRDFEVADPPVGLYLALAAATLAGLGCKLLLARQPDEVRAADLVLMLSAFLWLVSPHYAWYFVPLVALLARQMSAAALTMTLVAPLLHLPTFRDPAFNPTSAVYLVVFGAPLAVLALAAIFGRSPGKLAAPLQMPVRGRSP